MKPPYIGNERIRALVGSHDGVKAARRALTHLLEKTATEGGRQRYEVGGGRVLNWMWAASLGAGGKVLCKTYVTGGGSTVRGANLTLLVYDAISGDLLASLAGDHLGAVRTAGASVLISRLVGVTRPSRLTVVGTGFQATHHVRIFRESFPSLDRVRVVARTQKAAQRMSQTLVNEGLAEADLPEFVCDPMEAVRDADLVVTATGSEEPVIRGSWLSPGTHLCCVGSNSSRRREIDRTVLERAALIVVDEREVAERECGDLLRNDWPVGSTLSAADLMGAPRHVETEAITVFESQGLALYDLMLAEIVLARIGHASHGGEVRGR